ncbi:O-antigen ligase [Flavobacterium sp. CS20]|uniref:O-antigen ligase family protein n=1 Tax=Flavobacterium sp. CS20 TaxID=2775246 RepID=UPI001B3A4DA9|nr:O-antigen ligase family protein [Flavobacterium sp. CS20]QTY27248.1 O-antigen ligase family protein [Flavobacterium sp. CS20]
MNQSLKLTQKIKKPTDLPYLNEVIFHGVIGFAIYAFRPLSLIYTLGILIFFILKIIRNPNNPFIIIQAFAYVVVAEVFLRMTGGFIFYETGKYSVILFMIFGLYYHNFKTSGYVYIVFLLLLLPSVIVTFLDINYETNFRKTILFNISGPLSLFATALFCYKREIKLSVYLRTLDTMVLPIVAMAVYLFFYTPDLQKVVTGADSNFATSGGFGPNQVSTILGLGMFCIYVRLFLTYKHRLLRLVMYGILAFISYRALATLSRGGVLTAVIMCFLFTISFLRYATPRAKAKGVAKIIVIILGAIAVWSVTLVATNNMLYNKYTDRNARGIKQGDLTTGRVEIAETEFEAFFKNPIFGIGVGMAKFYRAKTEGIKAASHNEVTRLISEHGFFGILSILLLIGVPSIHFLTDNRNIFILPLIVFWFLTINHSAMRIAAPGFIYGLGLLKVTLDNSDK